MGMTDERDQITRELVADRYAAANERAQFPTAGAMAREFNNQIRAERMAHGIHQSEETKAL